MTITNFLGEIAAVGGAICFDIKYIIFKNHMIKTNDIKQLAKQFCDIAIDIR